MARKLGKTCTTIAADHCDAMAKKAGTAFALGTELVELRIDKLLKVSSETIVKKLDHLAKKSILTVRSKEEGGGFWGTEAERLKTISALATIKPAYLDLELETAKTNTPWMKELTPGTRKIISWHDFDGTPPIEALRSIREEAKRYGKLVKIVTMAKRPEDNVTVLKLYDEDPKDLIAFCMGAGGTASRMLSFQLGSPIVYASLPGEPVAPGQLSIVTVNTLKMMMERGD